MKSRNLSTRVMIVLMTVLLSLAGGLAVAAKDKPMKPELAAKKENFRKQNEQRITPEKRKSAVDALKAERLKIYQAKQASKQSNRVNTDNK
jgi:hypothetical protein